MSDALSGTAGAPLAATRAYTFRREGTRLLLPVCHRGSWDDFGIAERPEQEGFVRAALAALGVPASTGYPGEWVFPDVAALDRAWTHLEAVLRPPASVAPSVTLQRTVSAAEARAVSDGVRGAYFALGASGAGLGGEPFAPLDARVSDLESEAPTRTERWKGGGVLVNAAATGLGSGPGVHGEDVVWTVVGSLGDGRDAVARARIDLRTGGTVAVTVHGVNDAERLAERFLAG